MSSEERERLQKEIDDRERRLEEAKKLTRELEDEKDALKKERAKLRTFGEKLNGLRAGQDEIFKTILATRGGVVKSKFILEYTDPNGNTYTAVKAKSGTLHGHEELHQDLILAIHKDFPYECEQAYKQYCNGVRERNMPRLPEPVTFGPTGWTHGQGHQSAVFREYMGHGAPAAPRTSHPMSLFKS